MAFAGVILLLGALSWDPTSSSAQGRDLVAPGASARRLALVIGNDAYPGAALTNARNDARSMAQALRALSFDVTVLEDGTRAAIGAAMLTFARRLTKADLAFVYYAGHGVQVEGVNYLIPVEFDGLSEDAVRINALSADEITRTLTRARVGVLVLDACRNNPYSGQRSTGRGLAQLEAQGLLVAFATAAGQTASDGGADANGVFTRELVQVLGTPGRGLRDTFFEVQRRVQQATGGRQFPAVYSQLVDDVVLTAAATVAAPAVVERAPAADLALRAELELWDAIKGSTNATLYREYLTRYPNGQFRSVAEDRLARTSEASSRPPSAGTDSPAVAPGAPVTMNSAAPARIIDRPALRSVGPLDKSDIIATRALADRFVTSPTSLSDIGLSFQPFFYRSQEPRTFVPFVLTLSRPLVNDAVMIVRLASRSLRGAKTPTGFFPWDDIQVIAKADGQSTPTRVQRSLMAPPGAWDVYVTIAERVGSKEPELTLSKVGLLRAELDVPDFWRGELATSTLFVADKVSALSAPLSQDEARTRPFAFGTLEMVPAPATEFTRTESLPVFFQVYNFGLDSTGKPNLTFEFEFHKSEGTGEKFFNKTSPQVANATNLPPQFDPAKFPVPGGIEVPLASFGEGSYRLNVKVTDKANNNKVLSQDVKFRIKG